MSMRKPSALSCRYLSKLIKISVERKICKYFAHHRFDQSFTLTQISRELEMPTSTVHNALIRLHGRGVIRYENSNYGGQITTNSGIIVPYEFTCQGCQAYIHITLA